MLPILFASPGLVILNKPAGLPAHAGPRGGPSVEDEFPRLSRRRTGPWLIHRLDTDTAGCLAVALRRAVLIEVQALFAAAAVRKTYWAVVAGAPPRPAGTLDAPLLKRTGRAGWRMTVDPAGQPATTEWTIRGQAGGLAWLELRPRTGRTHQLRAHCAHLGCPVLGDPVYGDPGAPLHLLARRLELPLDPPVEAIAPVPPHMQSTLRKLGWPGEDTALTDEGMPPCATPPSSP